MQVNIYLCMLKKFFVKLQNQKNTFGVNVFEELEKII